MSADISSQMQLSQGTSIEQACQQPQYPAFQSQPQQPVQILQTVGDDPKSLFVRWWLGQEASTVILIAILIGGSYMTWWHVTQGAPEAARRTASAFLEISKENNATHKEIAEKTAAAIKEAAVMHEQSVNKMQMSFERALDRADRRRDEGK